MHLVLPLLLVLGLVFGPGIWVRRVLAKYSEPGDRYAQTGAALARELLDRHGLTHVAVERTEQGDHYDPEAKKVRLTAERFDGRSLAAIAVAAHEVGHALQDRDGYRPLRLRTRLVRATQKFERVGAGLLMASPFIGLATRAAGILSLLGGFLSLGSAVVVHAVTLPTEFDASFRRALPLLKQGGYLYPPDPPHARRILTAAALTYVASALMSLLNIARWWTIIRR